MEIEITGLKCDHCDYRDDTVRWEDYQENIGRQCPNCSHSLLTINEYLKCLTIYQRVEQLNKIGNVLKWINPFHYWRLVFGDIRKMQKITKRL